MITDEERQSIINEAVEKALLMLPEVVGNLIMNQANLLKLNRQFYEKNPEFASRKDLVASVVEKMESSFPGLEYSEVLKKAVPLIRERIGIVGKLDLKSANRPSRDLSSLNLSPRSDHGEL